MKSKTSSGPKAEKKQKIEWPELIKYWVMNNIKTFASIMLRETSEGIKCRFKDFFIVANKIIVSSLLVFLGVVFLMVGIALFLNELFNISGGLGFLLVGILAVFLGVMVREELKENN